MRRATGALVVLAALLPLLSSAAFHAHPLAVASAALDAPGASAFAGERDHAPRPHDADLCPICQAQSQARWALRAPVRAGSPTLAGAILALPLAVPEAPGLEPVLATGAPRAPPASSALEG